MNCVSEHCKHLKWTKECFDNNEIIKAILVPYCELGRKVRCPFEDNNTPLNCAKYEKAQEKIIHENNFVEYR